MLTLSFIEGDAFPTGYEAWSSWGKVGTWSSAHISPNKEERSLPSVEPCCYLPSFLLIRVEESVGLPFCSCRKPAPAHGIALLCTGGDRPLRVTRLALETCHYYVGLHSAPCSSIRGLKPLLGLYLPSVRKLRARVPAAGTASAKVKVKVSRLPKIYPGLWDAFPHSQVSSLWLWI